MVGDKAVVTKQGLNILASFQKSALKKASTVICSDQSNKDLYNKELTGKIICLPQTIGSTTGGMILHTIADIGIGPKALLFSKEKNLIAFPVGDYNWRNNKSPKFGKVYTINLDDGFILRGDIKHSSDIERMLFMDDVLYGVSETNVSAHNINTIEELNRIDI